jgi:hypothetical protein
VTENALYYTFSTVAQTLAAALAILAAFIVFRLPDIETLFADFHDEAHNYTTKVEADELLEAAQRGGRTRVDARLKDSSATSGDPVTAEAFLRRAEQVHNAWNTRQTALYDLRAVSIYGGTAISGSLMALPFVPYLACHAGWARSIVAVILVLSIFTLGLNYRMIRRVIDPRTRPRGQMVGGDNNVEVGKNPGAAVGGAGVNKERLYSTFSVVSQTLAAVLAILIAIVVVRLPVMEADIGRARIVLRLMFPEKYEQANRLFEQHGVDGLHSAGFRVDRDYLNTGIHIEAGYRALTILRRAFSAVWAAIIVTFVTIATCLIALPAVPYLAGHARLAWGLVVAVVGLAVISFLTYIWLIAQLLGRPV